MTRRVTPLDERLYRYVVAGPGGCHIWTGTLRRDGYGVIGAGRRGEGVVRVHRWTYEQMFGPVPDGLVLDHLCRNRRCCNPLHLEPVTRGVNTMRGDTIAAHRAAQTECIRGHPFDDDNTVRRADGRRECRACRSRRAAK